MKKKLIILLLCMTTIGLLPGCGKTTSEPATQEEISTTESETETQEDTDISIDDEKDLSEETEEEKEELSEGQSYGGTVYLDSDKTIALVTLDEDWIVSANGMLKSYWYKEDGSSYHCSTEIDYHGTASDAENCQLNTVFDRMFAENTEAAEKRAKAWNDEYDEKDSYSTTIDTDYGKVGISLCWNAMSECVYADVIAPIVDEDGTLHNGYLTMHIIDSAGLESDGKIEELRNMVQTMTDETAIDYVKPYINALK